MCANGRCSTASTSHRASPWVMPWLQSSLTDPVSGHSSWPCSTTLSFLEACRATCSHVGYVPPHHIESFCSSNPSEPLLHTGLFLKTAPPSAQVIRPCCTNRSSLETSARPQPRVLQPLPLSAWALVVPMPPATHHSSR